MFWLLVSFLILISHHKYDAFVAALNDEGLALLSFKSSLQNISQTPLINWNSLDVDPCSWHGITCAQNRVVSLILASNQLSGHLSPALGNLSALRNLNLKNNYFQGSIPVELRNAKGLQSLVLSGNSLSGSLPTEVGNLKYLQSLDLSQNQLSGPLPAAIAQCKKLRTLVLSQNSFNGSLPTGLGTNLNLLQKLNLSYNSFHDLIPNDIGNLSSLQGTLDLSHNLFSGPIPATLGSLPEDVYIDLSFNNLSGPIPEVGTLVNVGPTAFINNPQLCGFPLKISCSSSSDYLTQNPGRTRKHGHSSSCRRITVVVGTMVGISLLVSLIALWYKRIWVCTRIKDAGARHMEEKLTISMEIFCFSKRDADTLSENMDQCNFVALDPEVNFDLELLLKASAFLLGKSANGIVYKVVLDNGPTVVVRRLEDGSGQRFREFQSEVEALGKIRHPNVVSLRAYCCSDDEKLLIYDYVPNGDLAVAIHGKVGASSFRPLSWSDRVRIMKGIARGLAFLHEYSPKRYVHGNLKPRNILLGENMEPRISDLGLGRLAYIPVDSLSLSFQGEEMSLGTPQQSSPYELTPGSSPLNKSYYQAPEASRWKKPSQKWDVYSFGVMLLEMISGKSPPIQVGSLEMDLAQWVQHNIDERKPLSFIIDPFLALDWRKEESIGTIIKLALACIQKSPDRRPTMRYVSDTLEKVTLKIKLTPSDTTSIWQ